MARSVRTLIVAEDPTLRFALVGSAGAVALTGRFPEEAPAADELVVADFGLLRHAELFSAAPGNRVGLLADPTADAQPGTAAALVAAARLASVRGVRSDFAQLAQCWVSTPEPLRVFVEHTDRRSLEPLLGLRRDAQRETRRAFDQVFAHLRSRFPRYAELFVPSGALRPEGLGILREYPVPAHLLEESSTVRLRGVLERALGIGTQPGVDEFFEYRAGGADQEQSPAEAEASVRLVLDGLERAELHARQAAQLDRSIQRLALDGTGGPQRAVDTASAGGEVSASVFDLPARSATAPGASALPAELPKLFERLRQLRLRSGSEERHARSELEAYALLRVEIDWAIAAGARASESQLLEREIVGQALALGANDFHEASRFLAEARRLLLETPRDRLTARERIDAELTCAITGLVTTDVPTGFGRLRQTLQDGRIEDADPALRSQALGLEMLTLVFYGETPDHESLVALARAMADAPGAIGAARAGQDIAELMVAGTDPATSEDRLAELIDHADRNSRDTYFRPFFNFIMMTVCSVTRDRDAAAQNYAELRRNGVWEEHSRALFAQARLSQALHLAGAGEFSAARRELAETRPPGPEEGGGSFALRRGVLELYLLAAIGDYDAIREATEPDAPLGEQTLRGLHAIRYLPATLVLRGTALVRDGAAELGGGLFRQATAIAARFHGWAMLLCGETAEYRDWLTALPEAELPEGLTQEARDRIASRPLFFAHELPALTEQQVRVLRLLALGRSTGAIASDLHITANTLKTHLRRLYARLGVNNRREAVHLAEAYGFLD